MTKFFKFFKILRESLIRNCSPPRFHQPTKGSVLSNVEGERLTRLSKDRKETVSIAKLQRPIWNLGSNLARFFLFQIPPTLIMARGFSSRYLMPPRFISKTGSNKASEFDKFTLIPTWMKKTKVKKFQNSMGNIKNKNQKTSENKYMHDINASGPKFKLTNLLNRKSKNIQLMTENLKQKKFKAVLTKLAIPRYETKHLVMKKKNIRKELIQTESGLENSTKKLIHENSNSTTNNSNKSDLCSRDRNKQAEESMKLEYRNLLKPQLVTENNIEKSLTVVSEQKLKKHDDRSGVRRHKSPNLISEKGKEIPKLNAKHFEKPEVDLYIKKLAAKYGKTHVKKNVKPIRTYENNRPRIKYDLDTNSILTNGEDLKTKHVTSSTTDKRISNYSLKHLTGFIKKDTETRRILKKGNNLTGDVRTILNKVEKKTKRDTILRKGDFADDNKIQSRVQFMNKKVNAAIKLNPKNGLLKNRDKYLMAVQKKKSATEVSSISVNITDNGKGTECTNGLDIKKEITYCENKKQIVKDVVPCSSKNIESQLTRSKTDRNKMQKKVSLNTYMNNEPLNNLKESPEEKSLILSNNHINTETKLTKSETLTSNKNEYPAKMENTTEESKKSDSRQPIGSVKDRSTTLWNSKSKDKCQLTVVNVDTNSKPTEQMKYMKFNPDSPNYIFNPKKRITSCKYKMSRGVHSNKPDLSTESLRNVQLDHELNNKDIEIERFDDLKKNNKKVMINENVNIPSKVHMKNMDEKISLPMKIYKFHSYSECLDYKVYTLDSNPSRCSDMKECYNVEPKIKGIDKQDLGHKNTFRKHEYQCIVSEKEQFDIREGIIIKVNTVRKRFPPIVNLKNVESITKKKLRPLTAIHSIWSTTGENVALEHSRVCDSKSQNMDSTNQTEQSSEISKQVKTKNAIHIEEVEGATNSEGKKNISIFSSLRRGDNLISDETISIDAQMKVGSVQSISIKQKIKDIKAKGKERINKKNTLEGYNIQYSLRELKYILPFIQNFPDKKKYINTKEQINLEPIETNVEHTGMEKEFFREKKPISGIKGVTHSCNFEIPTKTQFLPFISSIKNESALNNKLYNPNVFCTVYSEEPSKDHLKGTIKKYTNEGVEKNKKKEIVSGNSEFRATITKQQSEASQSDQCKSCPSFKNKIISDINLIVREGIPYTKKKEENVQYPNIIEKETKQYELQRDKKLTLWKGNLFDLVSDKNLLNKKVRKNLFLMQGFNKVSFLKVFVDISHVTPEMANTPKLITETIHMRKEHNKNKINKLEVLENDLKTLIFKQLEQFKTGMKYTKEKGMKEKEYFRIYDLFDCTFVLQSFNKVSLNFEKSKKLTEEITPQSIIAMNDSEFNNETTENDNDRKVSIQTGTKEYVSDMLNQIKSGKLENIKDIPFLEVLDCRIPMKYINSTVKEPNTDDILPQMFNLINSKHMRFYSKYRRNCFGNNVIMQQKKDITNEKSKESNTCTVNNSNVKQDHLALNKIDYLQSTSESSSQNIPILPSNMKTLTFQDIYDYNQEKQAGNGIKKTEKNEYLELENKERKPNGTKKIFKKEPSLNVGTRTNLYIQPSSKTDKSHSASVKKYTNKVKIEPEVLHYMHKLDVLSSKKDLSKMPSHTVVQEINDTSFTKETITKNNNHNNEPNDYFSNEKIKDVSDHYRYGIKKKKPKVFLKEIYYSNEIKFLKNNDIKTHDVVNECKMGTFRYLTNVIKKHKMNTNNLISLEPAMRNERQHTSDVAVSLKNHEDKENIKKFLSENSAFAFSTSNEGVKYINKNYSCGNEINSQMLKIPKEKNIDDIEPNMIKPNKKILSLNKNVQNEYKPEKKLNLNKVSSELVENSVNKLEGMNQANELEKQMVQQRNLDKKNVFKEKYKCSKNGDPNKIKSNNQKLNVNNLQEKVTTPIQNELGSLKNTEFFNKMSPNNKINGMQKTNTGLSTKIKLTKFKNNNNTTKKDTFQGVCLRTKDLREPKNLIKITCINKQNDGNPNRVKTKQNFDTDINRSSHTMSNTICKVKAVLNKKYGLRPHRDTISNAVLTRDESKNLSTNLNLPKKINCLEIRAENNMLNEISLKGNKVTEKMNTSEVKKSMTREYKNNDETNKMNTKINEAEDIMLQNGIKNEEKDFKTITNKNLTVSSTNEWHISESIPTGLRCIKQHQIESDNPESIKQEESKIKHNKVPLRNEISKSVTSTKTTLKADYNTKLNQYLLDHKKQLQNITNDQRVKSIKNKLSNNLKPKVEVKIINRQSHTLMSTISAESNKRVPKKGKEDGHCLQKSSINKAASMFDLKDQKGATKTKTFKAPETKHFSDRNIFFDCSPIKMATATKEPLFDTLSSENKFRPINEYNNKELTQADDTKLRFTQQNVKLKKDKNKETNDIKSGSFHSIKKSLKSNERNNHRENPIYLVKAQQPKDEGFISQTLRSSYPLKSPSSKLYTGIVKKRQTSAGMKYRIKSELKQSAINLKKKISKQRTLKTDIRFNKTDLKKNNNIKTAKSSEIFPQNELPMHLFQEEQKKPIKKYLLETPSRQACTITPPKQVNILKPLMKKTKVTTKLIACTKQTDNVKRNREPIQCKPPEKESKLTFKEMCQIEKGTCPHNHKDYQFDILDAKILKNKCNDQNKNLMGRNEHNFLPSSTIGEELISGHSKLGDGLAEKELDRNGTSKSELKTSFKNDINIPSIVGNVVNNVKTKLRNFLSADTSKYKLDKEMRSKSRNRQEVSEISKNTYKEKNELEKLKNIKQIPHSTLRPYDNDTINQAQFNKNTEKKKMKSRNNNRNSNKKRKKISDLLRFNKPLRYKPNCPQMSYSEILNKFHAGCET